MIVYNEMSSIKEDLGYDIKTLYSISNSLPSHYISVRLPKKQGGFRVLSVPDMPLKCIQKRIADVLLSQMPISPYAKAYRCCASTVKNAAPHLNKSTVLKLDIRSFFDNILYSTVKNKAFPKRIYSERIRILLSMLCCYNNALPQGAPTSPAISNIVMYDFDNAVGSWCAERGISYTRYCDDMTFSGDLDTQRVIAFVEGELQKLGLFLNKKKTVIASSSKRQIVTGIVVNKAINVPREYKKAIRQEIYYCKKFGAEGHLAFCGIDETADTYLLKLAGRVNYVLSVCPGDKEFLEYRSYLKEQLKKDLS